MSVTTSSDCILGGFIPLKFLTGDTVDIYEYLNLGFYDQFRKKTFVILSPFQPGIWLGVSRSMGMMVQYHIITHSVLVFYCSTVQWFANI